MREDGTAIITSYVCEEDELTIPAELDGHAVTGIGEKAFSLCLSLTSVTIPDSVTTIGESAFSSCPSLMSVTIPDSVTTIGRRAFFGCPDTLTITVSRDSYAAQYCIENNLNYTYPDYNDWLNS